MESVSIPTTAHMLKRYPISLKQLYYVLFERNADIEKQQTIKYVQFMALDASKNTLKFIFVAQAGFQQAKTKSEVRISLVSGTPSQYLDNVRPTSHVCCYIRRWCGGMQILCWLIQCRAPCSILYELNLVFGTAGEFCDTVWDNVDLHDAFSWSHGFSIIHSSPS